MNTKYYIPLLLVITICFQVIAHDKWIVVTTINYPTPALEKLAKLKDWKLVVVGDKKTPKDWHLENCKYLDPEIQETLNFSITKHLPWNHYSRKNVGYLYAIKHGAKVIYETDDDNILIGDTITFVPEHAACINTKSHCGLMNPYCYFGQPNVWPRGYPLRQILANDCPFFSGKINTWVPVQQGLVNCDPDVDAIFRLTHNNKITFDNHKKPLALERGTLCPFNTQNTLIYHDAFWGMVIPISVSFRTSDIWRGYWFQRLLWDIGAQLCFVAPNAEQYRNEHDLLKDFIDETDLYTKAEDLANYLRSWQSCKPTLKERIVALMENLIEQDFFKSKELSLIKTWLEDLEACGYQMPPIQFFN